MTILKLLSRTKLKIYTISMDYVHLAGWTQVTLDVFNKSFLSLKKSE